MLDTGLELGRDCRRATVHSRRKLRVRAAPNFKPVSMARGSSNNFLTWTKYLSAGKYNGRKIGTDVPSGMGSSQEVLKHTYHSTRTTVEANVTYKDYERLPRDMSRISGWWEPR